MGIMTQMRDRMKIILGILILAFLATILFSWGMGYNGPAQESNLIGSVNGRDITVEQFYQTFNNELNRIREQGGQEISEQQRIRIRDQVWENIVSEYLVQSEIEKYGLVATDDEIYFQLENNPPDFLRSSPAFQTDGRFDMNKYLDILHNPQGDEWVQIENIYRNVIPGQKLQNLITASVTIGEADIRDAFIEENVNFTVDHLSVPFSITADADITVSDEDMKKYYEKNKTDKYSVPEKRVLQYVWWEKKPGREDTTLVLQDIDEVKLRLEEGEAFADLAELYSADGTASRGGDLGWFGRGQMVGPFEDAVFSAPLGKVIGPVLTQFGYHLILVHEKKMEEGQEMIHASHILMKIETGPNTIDALSGDARMFSYDAEDLGFERALQTYSVSADTTKSGIAREDYYFPVLGAMPELTHFAFIADKGKVSEVIESEKYFAVAQLIAVNSPTYRKFEDVKTGIERALKNEQKEKIALKVADSLYAMAASGSSLADLAAGNDRIQSKSGETFMLKSMPAALKGSETIKTVLLGLEQNSISRPVKGPRSYLILKLNLRSAVDEEKYRLAKADLQQKLLDARRNEVIGDYMQDLRDRAKIKDFRTDFF